MVGEFVVGTIGVEDATGVVGIEDGAVVAGGVVVRGEVPALDEAERVVRWWICVDAEVWRLADGGWVRVWGGYREGDDASEVVDVHCGRRVGKNR